MFSDIQENQAYIFKQWSTVFKATESAAPFSFKELKSKIRLIFTVLATLLFWLTCTVLFFSPEVTRLLWQSKKATVHYRCADTLVNKGVHIAAKEGLPSEIGRDQKQS